MNETYRKELEDRYRGLCAILLFLSPEKSETRRGMTLRCKRRRPESRQYVKKSRN